mmetsp:Transcript_17389/g.36345  ORF Transcript_17389/g.36345 Transcript_17389/m.36345 type:complete len:182 (-) Transcript_17389:163-708(-)|eukprot:CAMPEP_0182539886 /NCGR_PEP_ID=MMETSP1323-20130603/26148_1 /TAXON_ID=236787 /ORGANISM="Florenciella parvula, Strain RCC1693" /LENGTH=181 /DNA_ID=CAMNT_0024750495 /DNA_START=172 /DNA_END=717 /DNA_ORIENTATION=+
MAATKQPALPEAAPGAGPLEKRAPGRDTPPAAPAPQDAPPSAGRSGERAGAWTEDAAGWLAQARAALEGGGGRLDELEALEALIRQGEGIGAKGRADPATGGASPPDSPLYEGEGEDEVELHSSAHHGVAADDDVASRRRSDAKKRRGFAVAPREGMKRSRLKLPEAHISPSLSAVLVGRG